MDERKFVLSVKNDLDEWVHIPALKGVKGDTGDDGVSPEVTVEEIEGGHKVTITDAEGDHEFNVMDGEDGASDAGSVSFDPEGTYAAGTVGAELVNQSSRIAKLEEPSEQNANVHMGFFRDAQGYLCEI